MKLEHDLLSPDDRALLQQLAQRLRPFRDDIVTEWVDTWVSSAPQRGVDPDAYRMLVNHLVQEMADSHLEFLGSGDLEQLFELQYQSSRRAARGQLGEDAIALASQHTLHTLSRSLYLLLQRWIERVFAEDPQRSMQIKLAHAEFANQMTQIISEAYSDEAGIYTRRVDEQLRQALDMTRRLASLSQAVVQSLDTEPVLDLALRTAIELLHSDGAALMLADPSATTLHLHTLVGPELQRPPQEIPVEGSLAGLVYRNDQPLQTQSLSDETQARIGESGSVPVQSLLIVPLRMRGTPVGTMAVACDQQRTFADSEIEVLQTLADYAAVALGNARTLAAVRDAGEQAKLANRAKSEFVAAVSHEIRSPLSALLGYVDMLRDQALGPLTEAQEDVLERLAHITRSTHHLTDDLLENARLEAGKLHLQVSRVDVPSLLAEISDVLRLLVEAKPIEVEMQIDDPSMAVTADPDRLRQIVLNLASNAAKFTQQGKITLEATRAPSPDRIVVRVHDTGPGIHPDDLPRIFELFYRGGGTDSASGAGIGLFLSRQLATMMASTLDASSDLGRGTCFTLSLPAWSAPQP